MPCSWKPRATQPLCWTRNPWHYCDSNNITYFLIKGIVSGTAHWYLLRSAWLYVGPLLLANCYLAGVPVGCSRKRSVQKWLHNTHFPFSFCSDPIEGPELCSLERGVRPVSPNWHFFEYQDKDRCWSKLKTKHSQNTAQDSKWQIVVSTIKT